MDLIIKGKKKFAYRNLLAEDNILTYQEYKTAVKTNAQFQLAPSSVFVEIAFPGGTFPKAALGGSYIPDNSNELKIIVRYNDSYTNEKPSAKLFPSMINPKVNFKYGLESDYAKEVFETAKTYIEENQSLISNGTLLISAAGTNDEFTAPKNFIPTTIFLLETLFHKLE